LYPYEKYVELSVMDTPAFRRVRQEDWEFEANLGYIVSSRPA
jgi:hypothetical protein